MESGLPHGRRDFAEVGQHALLSLVDDVKAVVDDRADDHGDGYADRFFPSTSLPFPLVMGPFARCGTVPLPQRDLIEALLVGHYDLGIAGQRSLQLFTP